MFTVFIKLIYGFNFLYCHKTIYQLFKVKLQQMHAVINL